MEIKGKSIQDIINIPMDDVINMNEKELRALTNRLVSASNKRLRRLKKSKNGTLSPVYTKTRFSTKGLNRNKLLSEFKRNKNFLTAQTSTVKGWNQYRTEVEERLGGRLPKNKVKKFWRVYRKFQETHFGGMHSIQDGSERMMRFIREMYIDNKIIDEDELLERAESFLDEEYQKEYNFL